MKILICIDAGTAGEVVLREAITFFKSVAPSEVEVYSVMDLTPISLSGGLDSAALIRDMEDRVNELKETTSKILVGIPHTFSTELGYPTEKILDKTRSSGCDLVILGTHGRTGFNHLIIGSVAEKVLQNVACNSLVIPLKHKS